MYSSFVPHYVLNHPKSYLIMLHLFSVLLHLTPHVSVDREANENSIFRALAAFDGYFWRNWKALFMALELLILGLPGSGKSSMARYIATYLEDKNWEIFTLVIMKSSKKCFWLTVKTNNLSL